MSLKIKTRATNKDRHPGASDLPAPHCSYAEVAAAKKAESQAKQKVENAKKKGISAVAQLEDTMHKQDIATDLVANHPPSLATCKARPSTSIVLNSMVFIEFYFVKNLFD
jgi:hypothetical protein